MFAPAASDLAGPNCRTVGSLGFLFGHDPSRRTQAFSLDDSGAPDRFEESDQKEVLQSMDLCR